MLSQKSEKEIWGMWEQLFSTLFLTSKKLYGELEVMGNFGDIPCQIKGFGVETTKTPDILK